MFDMARLRKPFEFEFVLCGDCLRVSAYSDAKHGGELLCDCGGEFCGCEDCVETIRALANGARRAEEIGCKHDLNSWSPDTGCVRAEASA